jgi:hypothetical protein
LTGVGYSTANKQAFSDLYFSLDSVPVYGYQGSTYMYITPSFVGPSPQFPGLFQINFQIDPRIVTSDPNWHGYPPAWPCGNYNWELGVDIQEGFSLNPYAAFIPTIPVAIRVGDVPCNQ